MKIQILIACFIISFGNMFAQATVEKLPEFQLKKSETEMHLRFLAADELKGRRTTDEGNNIAARYIAEQLRAYGVKQVDGADGYFQHIPFEKVVPAKEGSLAWGENTFETGNNFLVMSGNAIDTAAEAVFANYGWVDEEKGIDDYKDLDVKGKIVVVISGVEGSQDPSTTFNSMSVKKKLAAERGAVALIELYRLNFPWRFFQNYFGKERLEPVMQIENEEAKNLVYAWLKEDNGAAATALNDKKNTVFHLKCSGFKTKPTSSKNVIGLIEGTDPVLKNEYIILSAHFDHVGVGKQGGGAFTEQDSIFNGARDNAMGTVGILAAAKSLAEAPPRRSVIILALTGEEMGLLGSRYYVENPLIPLSQCVFNLNSDGAGYDDTEAISIIGYDRVGSETEFDAAAQKIGLRIIPDPAPEQNLFDRSDNASFAAKGIPAPSVSPGTTGFTEEIMKYYHQAIDNPETIDFDYLLKFCKTFAHIARLVADKEETPRWAPGDKYEKVGKELYNY